MKLGLHAFSYLLAGGLREYQPVARGALSTEQLLDKAAQHKFAAVQLALRSIPLDDMVTQVNLRRKAEELGLVLHLSTNTLAGGHLADLVRAAYTMGAAQVTVGMARLYGNVQQRRDTLERKLGELDEAIKTAERYRIMLAIENGRHLAAADLAAFIQAAQSEWVGVCYDMGNALTVPESPVEGAEILAPYCKSAHLKDFKVYRTEDGVTLANCPIGEGTVEAVEVLRVLKTRQPGLLVFLQTVAERLQVPLLSDDFLKEYPRITARALAGVLRRGIMTYEAEELQFPHERKSTEKEVLKWEEERLKQSLKQAQKLMGAESLTLPLG